MLNPASGTIAYLQSASLIASGLLFNPGQFIATRVLPVMPVTARQGFYYRETAGSMNNRIDTRRAPGAAFARVGYAFSHSTYATQPHGVEMPVPDEHMAEYNPQFGGSLTDRLTMVTMGNILTDYENIVSGQLFNATNYPSGSGTGFAAGNTWASSSGTPIDNVMRCIEEIRANHPGYQASDFGVIVPSARAREANKHPQLRTAIGASYTTPGQAPGNAPLPVIAENLKTAFGVGEVLIPEGNYRSGGTESSPTNSANWRADYVGVYLRAKFDASMGSFFSGLGVTLSWSEMAPAVGGGALPVSVVRYRENAVKSEVLQVSSDLLPEYVNSNAFMLVTGVA